MSEKFAAALEVLEEQLREQMDAVAGTKRTINDLSRRMGRQAPYAEAEPERVSVSTIRRDQFYGKALATASREYLEMRHQACEAREILDGLEQGGFDFSILGWKDETARLRNLSINLAKNTAIFHRLPNGTFGLAAWYPEAVAKKKARSDKNEGAKEAGEPEEATEPEAS